MPRTIDQVIAWTRAPANRNRHQGTGWHNMCEQYVNNAGDFNQTFGTAWLAAQASGPLKKSLSGIRDGAIGYWRGVWIDGEECGHVAFWHGGHWWMASDACGEARSGKGGMVGNGTGWITADEYARLRPAAKWQGWTMRHGSETLSRPTPSTAGETTTKLPPAPKPTPAPPAPPKRKKESMTHLAYIPKGTKDNPDKDRNLFIEYGPGFYHEFTGQNAANLLAAQIGANAFPVSRAWCEETKAAINLAATGKLPTKAVVPWYVAPIS